MTTHESQSSIAALFSSSTLVHLLRVFCIEPDKEYYQRELERMTGAHLRQLQRDLVRLEQAGLIVNRISGNRVYYRAQRRHPVFDDLRRVVLRTVGLSDVLRTVLADAGSSIRAAFVFGSFARGEDSADSDVDLFVIGGVSRRSLAGPLATASRELGREVNLVLMSPADLRARHQDKDHFVVSVLAEPRIWVVGDEQALAAIA
jgi:predicted nucleotidyltransferase